MLKLRHLLFDWAGLRVVDLGANMGALGPYVLERGAVSYVGTELNVGWASAGRAMYGALKGWTLHIGNARDADLSQADIVCALGLFHHMNDDDVRHVLQSTSAPRVLIEQPMGNSPLRNYKIRSKEWYVAELAEAGFTKVERFPYGFAYPIDRAILLAERVAVVETPPVVPTRRRIDLNPHTEYWQALAPRPVAIAALVQDDDPTLYGAWYRSRLPDAPDSHLQARVEHLRRIIADIRANGYDEQRWRTDPRKFDGVDGTGPISVRPRQDGTVTPWDGAHRACILRALGLPVIAEVVP